jgi:hypothetical protein
MIAQQPVALEIDDELWLALIQDRMDAMPEQIDLPWQVEEVEEYREYQLDIEFWRSGLW